jgi:hypothetical protein
MPPVYVVPAEPEDPYHDRATAEMLAAAIRGARLLSGAPVTPSPLFPDQRSAFVASLLQVFEWIATA